MKTHHNQPTSSISSQTASSPSQAELCFHLTKRRLSPYSVYKDSEVDWLGKIPEHWEVIRLKFLSPVSAEKLSLKPDELPYIGLENIESGSGRLILDVTQQNVDSSVNLFSQGDVLFGKLRPYLAKVLLADFRGTCTTELLVLKPRSVYPKFLFYYLISDGFIKIINSMTYGAKMPRASWQQIGKMVLLSPPTLEQRAIASFLDHETAKIDALIAKKWYLIELLQEKRSALISQAVTKGLDPDAPMKDSGVEWLGIVPKHWKVTRLAMAARKITNGYVGPTRDIFVKDGIRYLQSLHIKNGEIIFDKPYYVTEQWSKEHDKSILQEGDLLIVQTGSIGQVCAVPKEYEGTNCHALIVVQLKNGLGSGFYLSEFLQSDYGQNVLKKAQTGALHPHLECGKVRELMILLPPPPEQGLILSYIRNETTKIDKLIARVRNAIQKLQEYRIALISAAVTGKIDVRDQ